MALIWTNRSSVSSASRRAIVVFPTPGRSPQHQRSHCSGGQHDTEWAIPAKNVILTDNVSESTGTQPVRQGTRGAFIVGERRRSFKEIRHGPSIFPSLSRRKGNFSIR